jgi:hypothetical protein
MKSYKKNLTSYGIILTKTQRTMTERFEKAVDKLAKAYFNDQLKSGDCKKCAVGNMIGGGEWSYMFERGSVRPEFKDLSDLPQIAKDYSRGWLYEEQIEEDVEKVLSTGYTLKELAKVEYTFEDTHYRLLHDMTFAHLTHQEELDAIRFQALMEVVDLLISFEEDITQNEIEDVENIFQLA